jgi:low temperature requirement protein LtrA
VTLALSFGLLLVELSGPYIAERREGGTPWHAHHIAERYSLFAIIALGEGVVGTVAALSAVVEEQGWSVDAGLVAIAGVGLTFGIWWIYSMLPAAEALHAHRERSFVWGYGQMVTIAAIVATGAGLHVAAYYLEHKAEIGPVATVLSVAVPVLVFLVSVYLTYYYLVRRFDMLHTGLLGLTLAVAALAVLAALAGVEMAVCLVILMFAPAGTVVGYEIRGRRHLSEALAADARRTLH